MIHVRKEVTREKRERFAEKRKKDVSENKGNSDGEICVMCNEVKGVHKKQGCSMVSYCNEDRLKDHLKILDNKKRCVWLSSTSINREFLTARKTKRVSRNGTKRKSAIDNTKSDFWKITNISYNHIMKLGYWLSVMKLRRYRIEPN